MKYYILDTDSIGFAMQHHPPMIKRMRAIAAEDQLVTTIITFGEDLGGWLPACRRAPTAAARVQAYARMSRGLSFYQRMVCLPFDLAAAVIFDELRPLKTRIGTNDLSIAAITLSVKGILVTRNARDFQQVPDLVIEDWTT
ncbi:MAG: type II toxin-antitoxin system VapC family toxin [Acidobacteria bacterium]|nr:type II toxin-antitoxin system VapC family toxin [Acidobacteriota bacterium]